MTINSLKNPTDQRWSGDEYNYYLSSKKLETLGKLINVHSDITLTGDMNILLCPDGKVLVGGFFTTKANIPASTKLGDLEIKSMKGRAFNYLSFSGDAAFSTEVFMLQILKGELNTLTAIPTGLVVATNTMIYIPDSI